MVASMQNELPKRVADGVGRFTGRTWLLPKLLQWWHQETERVLLLSGGPGTGKSMVISWLAGYGPIPADSSAAAQLLHIRRAVSAVHLCQAASRNITPQAFAESIANQLTDGAAGFGEALAASLAERVSIVGNVWAGAAAPGSRLAGVSISHIDLSTLGDELSFDRAFAQPLKVLYAHGYSSPTLLLVDGLDEAQSYTGNVTLPYLLSRLADLPHQVRILATTRDEPRVLKFFRSAKTIDLVKDVGRDDDDIQTFVEHRLASSTAIGEVERKDFSKRLSTQACGVFLYAAMVLEELLGRPLGVLPDLTKYRLPTGLGGVYHDFLTRELGRDEERWAKVFRPVLGLISVARDDGLTASQISAILNRGSDEVGDALRACKQYLVNESPAGPFRSFHKSFSDYLLGDIDNSDYRIDAHRIHRQIAHHYYAHAGTDWGDCDECGKRNILRHALNGKAIFIVDNLFTDLYFLTKADPDVVLEIVPHLTKGIPAQVASAYGRVAHHFRDCHEGDRLSYLELAASQERVSLVAHGANSLPLGSTNKRWSVAWTNCEPTPPYIILQGHQGTISAITGGSTGEYQYVASGDSVGNIILWNRATGNLWKMLPERRPFEIRVLKSCTVVDKSLLLVGDAEGMVECWDLGIDQCIWKTNGEHWFVSGMTVVQAGHEHLLVSVSGGRDGRLTVFDLLTGEPVDRFVDSDVRRWFRNDYQSGFYCVTNYVHQGAQLVIAGGGEGLLRMWDCETGKLVSEHVAHEGAIYYVEVFDVFGESYLLTATLGRDIACWKLPLFEKMFASDAYHNESSLPVLVTGSFLNRTVVYLVLNNLIVLIDSLNGLEISRIEGVHSNWIRAIALNSGGRSGKLVMGGGDRFVYIADEEALASMVVRPDLPIATPTSKNSTALSSVTCGGHEYLICGFEDGELRLLDLVTGSEIGRSWQLPATVREARSLEYQGSTIIACRFDGGIWIWKESDDTHFTVLGSDHGQLTAFAIGLRLGKPALAIGTDQGFVGIRYLVPQYGSIELVGWHTHRSPNDANPEILHTSIIDLAFAGRGNASVLASAGWEDYRIKTWRLVDLSLVDVIETAHRESISRLIAAEFQGGSKLLSAGLDHCCKSWDVQCAQPDIEYVDRDALVPLSSRHGTWYVDLTTGRWDALEVVVAASRDGTLVIFDANVGTVLVKISVGYGLWGRRMAFSSSGVIAIAGARGFTALRLAGMP